MSRFPFSRRSLAILGVLIAMLMAFPSLALADSPNFHYATDSVNSALQLAVSFKETGLGNVTSTFVSINANATAVYQCWNNGGKHPQAGNKTTVSGPVTGGGNFPVRNGQTTGTITANPPGAGGFTCPSGQSLFLMSVTYTNVTITGAGGSLNLPDVSGSGKIPA